jgi:carbon storage regulator
MLVLTRRIGEEIVIDNRIRVTVVSIDGGKVRLGINAPPEIRVDRQEVHERRREFAVEPDVVTRL